MKIFTYIKEDSSRIHKKNFVKLKGRQLWTILVEELSSIGDFYIDTDSLSVKKQCDNNYKGVCAYMRKREYIEQERDPKNNLSPCLMMTKDFLERFVEDDEEVIVLTHVTSPFLKKETVLDAVKFIESDEYEFVHSVTSKRDFAWLGTIDKPLNFDPSVVQRTQDLEEVLFSNGAFFIFKKKNFMKYNNRMGNKNFLYKLDSIQGLEIDYQDDLKLAQAIAGSFK